MAEQDYYIKKLLMDKARFADLFNAQVFGGEQVLKPWDLEFIPDESGIVVVDSEGKKRLIQRKRDVVMKAALGAYFAIAAVEGQEMVHYGMPVRNMVYDALDYTEQVQQMEKQHRRDGDLLSGAEFLSGIKADDRLIPIISLVVYHGKNTWNGPRCLFDMMGFDESLDAVKWVKDILPDYKMNLVCVDEIKETERFQTSLQQVFTMLKYKTDKKKLYEYVNSHRRQIQNMDADSVMAVASLLGEEKRLMKRIEISMERQEGFDLCKAIDDLIADGMERGIEKGIEKGEGCFAALTEALLKASRMEDLLRAAGDKEFRNILYCEFGIHLGGEAEQSIADTTI